jgi:hypothetical protein
MWNKSVLHTVSPLFINPPTNIFFFFYIVQPGSIFGFDGPKQKVLTEEVGEGGEGQDGAGLPTNRTCPAIT